MGKQQGAADLPMRDFAHFLHKILGPPGIRQSTQLEPTSGKNAEATRHFREARSGKLVVRSNERLRLGKAGFHEQASALIQPLGYLCRGGPIKLEIIVMIAVLHNFVARIVPEVIGKLLVRSDWG